MDNLGIITKKSIEASINKVSLLQNDTIKVEIRAILAGMMIALGGLGSQIINAATNTSYMGAFIFPAGLIFVIMTGSELFTGDNTMINGVLSKKIRFSELLYMWFMVYLGNFIGSIITVIITYLSKLDALYNGKVGEIMVKAGITKMTLSKEEMVVRGILCNILVCLAVLMAMKATSTIGKSILAYIPVMLFVLCGGEHSIANMYFLPISMLINPEVSIGDYNALINLFYVTIGNIIGGVFISILIYIAGKTDNKNK